jgi:hypothetical protein
MKKGGGGHLNQDEREKEVKQSEKWIEPRNVKDLQLHDVLRRREDI